MLDGLGAGLGAGDAGDGGELGVPLGDGLGAALGVLEGLELGAGLGAADGGEDGAGEGPALVAEDGAGDGSALGAGLGKGLPTVTSKLKESSSSHISVGSGDVATTELLALYSVDVQSSISTTRLVLNSSPGTSMRSSGS